MKHSGLTASKGGDKLFVCDFPGCDKRFKTKFSLCRHNLVHSQEKNYTCDFCGKKFALLQYLKEHTNTHTAEKPYVCGVAGCQERFSQTGKLSLHRRTHPEYKLKKYHSNSAYNKRHSKAKRKYDSECESESIEFPEPPSHQQKEDEISMEESILKGPEDLGKTELTAVKRVLQRQESGHTAATANGMEEWAKPPVILFSASPETNNLHTTPTKESNDENNNMAMPYNFENDPLIRYLCFLQTPFVSAFRPVLPMPEKLRTLKSKIDFQYSPLNLFELTSKGDN